MSHYQHCFFSVVQMKKFTDRPARNKNIISIYDLKNKKIHKIRSVRPRKIKKKVGELLTIENQYDDTFDKKIIQLVENKFPSMLKNLTKEETTRKFKNYDAIRYDINNDQEYKKILQKDSNACTKKEQLQIAFESYEYITKQYFNKLKNEKMILCWIISILISRTPFDRSLEMNAGFYENTYYSIVEISVIQRAIELADLLLSCKFTLIKNLSIYPFVMSDYLFTVISPSEEKIKNIIDRILHFKKYCAYFYFPLTKEYCLKIEYHEYHNQNSDTDTLDYVEENDKEKINNINENIIYGASKVVIAPYSQTQYLENLCQIKL